MTTTQPKRLIVDAYEDVNGYSTIRVDDGSPHGDVEHQPSATSYNPVIAAELVRRWNCHEELVAALRDARSALGAARDFVTDAGTVRKMDAAARAAAVLVD